MRDAGSGLRTRSRKGGSLPERGDKSRAAGRAMDILDLFFDVQQELTLTEIATRLDIPKSSAHAILQTMRARGYLVWDAVGKSYSPGLRIVALAQASPVMRTVQRLAQPHLEHLSETLNETALLGIFEGDR